MSAVNPVFKNVHPMILQEYAIYTPPIAEIFDVICEWIENKVPGGYIYGISRLGKSRAVKFWLNTAYFNLKAPLNIVQSCHIKQL